MRRGLVDAWRPGARGSEAEGQEGAAGPRASSCCPCAGPCCPCSSPETVVRSFGGQPYLSSRHHSLEAPASALPNGATPRRPRPGIHAPSTPCLGAGAPGPSCRTPRDGDGGPLPQTGLQLQEPRRPRESWPLTQRQVILVPLLPPFEKRSPPPRWPEPRKPHAGALVPKCQSSLVHRTVPPPHQHG